MMALEFLTLCLLRWHNYFDHKCLIHLHYYPLLECCQVLAQQYDSLLIYIIDAIAILAIICKGRIPPISIKEERLKEFHREYVFF